MSNPTRVFGKYHALLAGVCSVTGLAGYYAWNQQQLQHESNTTPHTATKKKEVLARLANVEQAFLHSQPLKSAEEAAGLCGRMKCMRPGQLTHLSSAHKPFSWVVGKQGIYELSQCKTDYARLNLIGADPDWIEVRLSDGHTFNLCLFPQSSAEYEAVCATWNGVFDLLQTHEPQVYARVSAFKRELMHTSFDDIESKSDFSFLEVDNNGPKDDRYLTKQRFLNIAEEELTLLHVRFFLYCYCGIARYFAGDGYTADKQGNKGCAEYLMKNMELTQIDHLKMIKLKVQLPAAK